MEQISNIEKRLWGSADTLRANSNFASNEYFMPVMGLIFLRHAYSRFLKVRDEIIPTLDLPRSELDAFAASVIERFQNPFIRHELITDLDMQRDIIDAGYLITSWDTTGDGVTGTLRLER